MISCLFKYFEATGKVRIVKEGRDLVGVEMHRQNRILGFMELILGFQGHIEAKNPKPVCYNYKWNSCGGTGEIVEVVAMYANVTKFYIELHIWLKIGIIMKLTFGFI
jgi:hypothetical protein